MNHEHTCKNRHVPICTHYKNSLITGQKNWEAEQRRIAEQKAAEEAALKKFQLRNDYRKMITNEGKIDRIHATNEANKAKSAQMSNAPEEKNYWLRSIEQIVFGNYSDEVTLAGTGGQVLLGVLGLDVAADLRDISYDLTHLGEVSGWQLLGDFASVLPFVGGVKYADEVFEVGSAFMRNGDELAGAALKNVDDAGVSLARNADTSIKKSGSSVDFYVKPNGDAIPSTGYRYISENAPYLDDMKNNMSIPANADGTYFSFDNFSVANPGALQVPHDASVRLSFDTLQIIDDINIPNGNWGKASYLEPITKDFPQFGIGGATQVVTHSNITIDTITNLPK